MTWHTSYSQLFSSCVALYDGSLTSDGKLANLATPGSYHGTISNCTIGVANKFGIPKGFQANSVGFNASTGISISKSAEPLGAKTILILTKTPTSSSGHCMYDTQNLSSSYHGTCLYLALTTGVLVFGSGKGGAPWRFETSGATNVCDGAWHVLGGSWDGTTGANKVKVLVDGTVNATATAASTESTTQSADIRLFGYNTAATTTWCYPDNPFGALLIFNVQKTDAEVAAISSLLMKKPMSILIPNAEGRLIV